MINTIQALRFFAAFFVVLHHAFRSFPVEYFGVFGNVIKINFAFGVDLFFVISGYVIYSSYVNKPKSAGRFIVDRLIRIAPMYWIYTTIFVIVINEFPTPFTSNGYEINNLLSSLVFLPSVNPSGGLFPTLTVGWTLNFEMAFYALFYLSIFAKSNNIAAFLIISITILNSLSSYGIANIFYADPIIYEFVFGVIIGYCHKNTEIINSKTISAPAVIILTMLIFMCCSTEYQRLICWGIPSAIIVSCCISLNDKVSTPKFLVILGDASYSLYLVHKVVMAIIIFCVVDASMSFEKAFLLSIFFSVILSIIGYKFIEKPLTNTIKLIKISNIKISV